MGSRLSQGLSDRMARRPALGAFSVKGADLILPPWVFRSGAAQRGPKWPGIACRSQGDPMYTC